MSDVPLGTPVQEIERAAEAFGIDASFVKAVAKIESDFNPRDRTGSYMGLFQLSKSEFMKYGTGDILNARDNAIAATYKFITEAAPFESMTHKKPTFSDLYLIRQQGWEGTAEHISHPQQIAWKSMRATSEGMVKGRHGVNAPSGATRYRRSNGNGSRSIASPRARLWRCGGPA